jgi:hypothetical protein
MKKLILLLYIPIVCFGLFIILLIRRRLYDSRYWRSIHLKVVNEYIVSFRFPLLLTVLWRLNLQE